MYINSQLQESNLLRLLEVGAFQFIDDNTPWFPYTSGQIGPYYVQSTSIEKDGLAYAAAIASLVQLIEKFEIDFDIISGGETRDWDFSNPCAVALRKPHLKIYKDGRMLGADVQGQRVLHIADLNNEGSSVRDYWHPLISKAGARIVGVIVYVDRMEEGVGVMRELNLPLASVVPLDERAWRIALEHGYVSTATYNALLERQRNPLAWALDRLRRYPEPLKRMYSNPRTRARAQKIIDFHQKADPAIEEVFLDN